MVSLSWITFVHKTWIVVGVILSTVLATVLSACPKDVSTKAHSCFTAYSFHFQNMRVSPQKLCCGVDVETLRAFCHSYTSAISCINQLRESCPGEARRSIDNVMVNFDGAKAGLQELCADDSIIETYAMYQSCFTQASARSEMCFQTHLNSSHTNIRFLSKINTARMDQFCNDMRKTVGCVQRNIRSLCGEKAERLAAILVKPMVRQSTDCDYSVINAQHKTTGRPYHGHHAYISDDHNSQESQDQPGGNSAHDIRSTSYVTSLMASLFVPLVVLIITTQGALMYS